MTDYSSLQMSIPQQIGATLPLTAIRQVLEENSILRDKNERLAQTWQSIQTNSNPALASLASNSLSQRFKVASTSGTTNPDALREISLQKTLLIGLLGEKEDERSKIQEHLKQNDRLLAGIHSQYKGEIESLQGTNSKLKKDLEQSQLEVMELSTKIKEVYAEKEKFEGLYRNELSSKSQLIHRYTEERFKLRSELEAIYQSRLEAVRADFTQFLNKPDLELDLAKKSVESSVAYLATISALETEVQKLEKELRFQTATMQDQATTIGKLEKLLSIEKDMRQLNQAQKRQSENANLELIAQVGGLVQSLPGLMSGLESGGLLNLLKDKSEGSLGKQEPAESQRSEYR